MQSKQSAKIKIIRFQLQPLKKLCDFAEIN